MSTSKIILAASAFALLTATAYAQDAGGVGGADGLGGAHRQHGKAKTAEAPKPKVDEKAYRAALSELPDKQFDPWHGVR